MKIKSRPQILKMSLAYVLALPMASMLPTSQAVALEISYAGRLTEESGKSIEGPQDFTVRFYNVPSQGDVVGPTLKLANTELKDGVFQLSLNFDNNQLTTIFGDGSKAVYVEVEAGGKVYPRQRLIAAPLALRVPVDTNYLNYTDGKLKIESVDLNQVSGLAAALAAKADATSMSSFSVTGHSHTQSEVTGLAASLAGKASSNASLSGDVGGTLTATTVDKIKGVAVATPSSISDSGKYLRFDGTNFVLAAVSGGAGGTVTAVSATPPLAVTNGSTTPALTIGQSSSASDGYLSASDFVAFNAKQAAITPSTSVNAGTVTSAQQNGVELKPFSTGAGQTGEVRFDELTANGTNYVGFKAPDSIATTRIWTLPAADGSSGQVLRTDGSGSLSWIAPGGGGTVTSIDLAAPGAGIAVSGGPVTGSGSITLSLANDLAAVEALSGTGGVERTGTDTWATYTLSAAGKALIDDADVSAQRTTLGLGALATLGDVGSTEITDNSIVNADINASAAIADSKLATISTSGKVANSATTATSANTASAIVSRDASGNFSAGTVTATIVGNVTGNLTGNVTGNLTGNVTGNVSGSAASFSGALAGDVTGNQGTTTVAGLRGYTVAATAPSSGNVLAWSGSAWTPTLLSTGSLTWNVVSATTANATANNGYLTTHASSRVTMTLPNACGLGDMIRVAGSGAGGWAIDKGSANFLSITGGSVMTAFNSSFSSQVADLLCSAVGSPVTWKMAALSSLFPPVLEVIPAQDLTRAQAFTYQLQASDPYGGTLAYRCLSGCPVGLTVNSSTGLVSWTPTADSLSINDRVVFGVTAGTLTSLQTTTLRVRGPSFAPIPALALPFNSPFSYQLVATSAFSEQSTFSCQSNCPSGFTVSSSGLVTWSPTFAQLGSTHQITVAANDGEATTTRVMNIRFGGMTLCGSAAEFNCYSGYNASRAQADGLAMTPSGKVLVWQGGLWTEAGGTRLLKVDGTDGWAMGLDMTGRTRTATELNKTTLNIVGRVCPASVFVPSGDSGAGLAVSGRCLYYDGGSGTQRLDATANDAATNQTTSGSIRLGWWNTAAGGNGAGASWYEGNIQTCAAKGMRLPTLYETAAGDPGGSYKPTDASPTFSSGTGVPSLGATWTSSSHTGDLSYYWYWNGTSSSPNSFNGTQLVRCVVP